MKMKFKRFALVIVLFCCPALGSSWLATAPQAQLAFTLDLRVSPASDLDPRNETSVAVNPLNDQIIVGASKVILGGASGLGTTRISFYSSSDGGLNWSTSLLGSTDGIETPQ